MLAHALTLSILFLRGQGSADHVIGLGKSLLLQPNCSMLKEETYSIEWMVKFDSNPNPGVKTILSQKVNKSVEYLPWVLNYFSKRLNFMSQNAVLSIEDVQQQDSGFYSLEVTIHSGDVCRNEFRVSVFDHVENIISQEQKMILDSGMCQVDLSCLVSSNKNVSYTWYNGSELIQMWKNHTHLVEQRDGGSWSTYTCNVSNPVSWKTHTFDLTRGCLSPHQDSEFPTIMVILVILLVIILLGILTGICVWKRKRKQPRNRPEECLTTYEVINHPQINRNQDQEQKQDQEGQQMQKQNFHGDRNTIYSSIQSQSSASTSQETSLTLYSTIQPLQKSGSKKKKNKNPTICTTIYEEVGMRQPRAQNYARLSQKELDNFRIFV